MVRVANRHAKRIGCVGLSVGGYRSFLLAALDPRISIAARKLVETDSAIRNSLALTVPITGDYILPAPTGPIVGNDRVVSIGQYSNAGGDPMRELRQVVPAGFQQKQASLRLDGSLTDPMWIGGRVAFLSDHEGYGNLYSIAPDGSGLRRHTDHEEFYVRHASTDGQRIVYESAGELWLVESLGDEPKKLDISLGSASTSRRPRPLDVARHLAAAVPNQDGTASVVESHGTIHWLTHRDGPSRVVEATPGVRARLARPLGADTVIYAADHDGVEALYLRRVFEDLPAATAGEPAQPKKPEPEPDAALPRPVSAATVVAGPQPASFVSTDEPVNDGGTPTGQAGSRVSGTRRIDFAAPTRVSTISASPDGKLAAVATEFGQLLVLEAESGELREVASTGHGAINEVVFSPDSRWLMWTEPVSSEGSRTKLRLAEVTASGGDGVLDITDGRFRDHGPAFSPDGKYAAFLSERSFDPVYDTHSFDLSFPQSTKPFLVALDSVTPSPFGPAVHGTVPEPAPEVSPSPAPSPSRPEPAPSFGADTFVFKKAVMWETIRDFGEGGRGHEARMATQDVEERPPARERRHARHALE